VDSKHGFILLEQGDAKNGERREIPINAAVRAAIRDAMKRLDIPYVFYDQDGQTLSGREEGL
jgi:hypothetical protein